MPRLPGGPPRPDETTINHRTKEDPVAGGHGRSHEGKLLIAGAVEIKGRGPGRVRLARIDDFSAASLHRFIDTNVAASATARTDGWPAYPGMPAEHHEAHVIGPTAAHLVLPWVHRVFSNLKTWALGVFHGLRDKHLQSYLHEFVFHFNRRRTRHAAFHSLLGIGMRGPGASGHLRTSLPNCPTMWDHLTTGPAWCPC